MQFLADMFITCDRCNGKRFRDDILKIKHRGLSISDVLDMTVDDALSFFKVNRRICHKLRHLSDTGLGYLKLGQPATTLSGGEAQRLKLATHIAQGGTDEYLFLFDEPTTGLHFDDVAMLVKLFQRLVEAGNTIIVIEHNLEVIKLADYLIDLGPEGGSQGGRVVASGTPEQVAETPASYTGQCLRSVLGR